MCFKYTITWIWNLHSCEHIIIYLIVRKVSLAASFFFLICPIPIHEAWLFYWLACSYISANFLLFFFLSCLVELAQKMWNQWLRYGRIEDHYDAPKQVIWFSFYVSLSYLIGYNVSSIIRCYFFSLENWPKVPRPRLLLHRLHSNKFSLWR